VHIQKISILLPTEGIGISQDWGSLRQKHLKKCIKLNWNIQGSRGLEKNPFHGGGMDIFWNYTINLPTKVRYKTDDELTLFGASNFGNKSFNHAVQI